MVKSSGVRETFFLAVVGSAGFSSMQRYLVIMIKLRCTPVVETYHTNIAIYLTSSRITSSITLPIVIHLPFAIIAASFKLAVTSPSTLSG
jgi:hypothetical protein